MYLGVGAVGSYFCASVETGEAPGRVEAKGRKIIGVKALYVRMHTLNEYAHARYYPYNGTCLANRV